MGADAYLWAEPEAGPRSVLACYPDREKMIGVERVIRGWVGEEPRALWTKLNAERKVRGLTVPEWLFLWQGSFNRRGPDAGIGYPEGLPETHNHGAVRPAALILRDSATALASLSWPAVALAEDAREVRVEEVAGWLFVHGKSWKNEGDHFKLPSVHVAAEVCLSADELARRAGRVAVTTWPPVAIAPDAWLVTPGSADLTDCVCYIDPTYTKADGTLTTGYEHDLTRADVLTIARAWSNAGALVMISEAVPVDGLGWQSFRIDHARRGQKRTWSVQQEEWLTMNRSPAHVVAEQTPLFAPR